MSVHKALLPILIGALLLSACEYIVLPEEEDDLSSVTSKGWSAVATHIGTSNAGDLHIDLSIRNETTAWSAMQAVPGQPAVLTAGDGKTVNCATVFVGTGGHRLAPGFQMRGFTSGTKAEPIIQMIYVECAGATAGSKLSINYSYVTGEYNYYDQEANKVDATLEVNLDQALADLKYPIAEPIEGLIQTPGAEMVGLNDVVLTLANVMRTDMGLQFNWQTANTGEYPSYVHIGTPPVIGDDGILYGYYETPDIVSVPITGAGNTAQWTTDVAVPQEVKDFYIMLSVESKKQRLFTNYAVDITDQ